MTAPPRDKQQSQWSEGCDDGADSIIIGNGRDQRENVNAPRGRSVLWIGRAADRRDVRGRARHGSLPEVVYLAAAPEDAKQLHCDAFSKESISRSCDDDASGVTGGDYPAAAACMTRQEGPKPESTPRVLPLSGARHRRNQINEQKRRLVRPGEVDGNGYGSGGTESCSGGSGSISSPLPIARRQLAAMPSHPRSPDPGRHRSDVLSRRMQSHVRRGTVCLDDPDSEVAIAITKSLDGRDLERALRSARAAASAGQDGAAAAASGLADKAVTNVASAAVDTAPAAHSSASHKPKRTLDALLSAVSLSLGQKVRSATGMPKAGRQRPDRRASESLLSQLKDKHVRRESDGLASEPSPGSGEAGDMADIDSIDELTAERGESLDAGEQQKASDERPCLCSCSNDSWPDGAGSDEPPQQHLWQQCVDCGKGPALTGGATSEPHLKLGCGVMEIEGWSALPVVNAAQPGLPSPRGARIGKISDINRGKTARSKKTAFQGTNFNKAAAIVAAESSSEGETPEGVILNVKMEAQEQQDMARIQKLFPNDDLGLAATSPLSAGYTKAASKWQMAVMKTFKRSQSGVSTLPSPSAATVDVVDGTPPVDKRKFLLEADVQLTVGLQTQERHLFLISDSLLLAKLRPSGVGYKLKRQVPVSDMWITDVVSDVSESSLCDPKRSFIIGWPVTNMVATFESEDVMQQWKARLTMVMNSEKSKEQPTIDVDIIYRDAVAGANGTKPTTLTLTRSTTAWECTCEAVTALGIAEAGSAANYQLWVTSSRENAAYPLFGHEDVFAIQMSHLRDSKLTRGPQCQFNLKDKKKSPPRLADRKQTVPKIVWDIGALFRKNAAANRQQLASPQAGKDFAVGKLIGLPLKQVCANGLPKVVEELLENLFNVAPFTCEIFRKPSNTRECQEVVNKMNTDEQVNWPAYRRNGLLMASVLKSFLKRLPDSLLHFEMYADWAESTKISERDERIATYRSLLSRLDECEKEVLKRIVCILYYVQKHSDTNRMTAYNLAVCLGPSLMWPPPDSKHDLNEASKLVPEVIQFMLDNCTDIFGAEEVLLAFGHQPFPPPDDLSSDREEEKEVSELRHGEADDESATVDDDETLRSLRTQCSESLESISDSDMPVALEQMSPSSRSRDSGLILNDAPEECDQSDDNVAARAPTSDHLPQGADASPTACATSSLASGLSDKSRSSGSLVPGGRTSDSFSGGAGCSHAGAAGLCKSSSVQRARRPSGLKVRSRYASRTNALHDESASTYSSESASAGADETPSPCHIIGSGISECFQCSSSAVLTKSSSGAHLCFNPAVSETSIVVCPHVGHRLTALSEQGTKFAESAPSLLNHRELSASAMLPMTAYDARPSAFTSSSSVSSASDEDVHGSETDATPPPSGSKARSGPSSSSAMSVESRSTQIRRRSLEPHRHKTMCGPAAASVAFSAVSKPRRAPLPERSVSVSERSFSRHWSGFMSPSSPTTSAQRRHQQTSTEGARETPAELAAESGERSVTESSVASGAAGDSFDCVAEVAVGVFPAANQAETSFRRTSGGQDTTWASPEASRTGADARQPGVEESNDLSSRRPNQPPTYDEAMQRHELNAAAIAEIERHNQAVLSARAKQLYARSLQKYEEEQQQQKNFQRGSRSSSRSSLGSRNSLDEIDNAAEHMADVPRLGLVRAVSRDTTAEPGASTSAAAGVVKEKLHVRLAASTGTSPAVLRRLVDSTVVKTKDRTVVIRRSPVARSSGSMFYQPGSEGRNCAVSSPTSSRPIQPPPYADALSHKQNPGSGGCSGRPPAELDPITPPESLV